MLLISDKWKDYEIIAARYGEKLERWGDYLLRRPDPQIFWKSDIDDKAFNTYDAIYHRSNKGGGSWEFKTRLPQSWTVKYKNLTFNVKPTGFKHTGIFPEQAVNWDYAKDKIENANRDVRVLNLFAYTGCATCNASKAGAKEVVHVDASKGMTLIAKENAKLSGIENNFIRYIVDDVFKFIEKEIRRGRKYDAVIMDPPSYGRGANGEIWKLEDSLARLFELVNEILVDRPLFMIINSYTTGLSPISLKNAITTSKISEKFENIYSGEIALPIKNQDLLLPCGIYARCDN
ncbi:class I SAM-dependent methyltransferase [Peptoanaerobacter stomatis]|uniref:class I SAM-dependent methyltransferase n=1 Tax=Peptoanaerobacter stomatis TaxID=796937 RepID=UPI003F9F27D5